MFAFLVLIVVCHCFVCVSGCLFAAIVLFAVCFVGVCCMCSSVVFLFVCSSFVLDVCWLVCYSLVVALLNY